MNRPAAESAPLGAKLGDAKASGAAPNLAEALRRALPGTDFALLRLAAATAETCAVNAFLVGGLVRDLLLARPATHDIDITVEGDAMRFARALAQNLHGTLHEHRAFLTATLNWNAPDGTARALDVVTARRECYPAPAALPCVTPAPLSEDLARRDFTVNAMAVHLSAAQFGALADPLNGQADLAARRLRILHPASFRDDPTRMFRAARFEARLHFRLDDTDEACLRAALPALDALSGTRIRHELELLALETTAPAALRRLMEWGVLDAVFPWLRPGAGLPEALEPCPADFPGPRPERFQMLLAALATGLSLPDRRALAARLGLSAPEREMLLYARRWPALARCLDLLTRPPRKVGVAALLLAKLPPACLLYLWRQGGPAVRAALERHHAEWRDLPPLLDGNDLRALRIPPGPAYARLLRAVRVAQLDGELHTRADALAFVRQALPTT